MRRRLQGQGVGGALLDYAESLRGRTEVGIVSCRTDLLDYYGRRGDRSVKESIYIHILLSFIFHIFFHFIIK